MTCNLAFVTRGCWAASDCVWSHCLCSAYHSPVQVEVLSYRPISFPVAQPHTFINRTLFSD
jgi:hypothetical protein